MNVNSIADRGKKYHLAENALGGLNKMKEETQSLDLFPNKTKKGPHRGGVKNN